MYSILIVDDEAIERDGIESLIKQWNLPFKTQKACNGQEAYSILQEQHQDILVTDIKMPFMGGLELCELARNLYPDIILIIFSAYNDFEFAKQAIKVRVDDYMLKPIILDEFHTLLNKIIHVLDMREERDKKRKSLLNKYSNASFFQKEKIIDDLFILNNNQTLNPSSENNDKNDKKVIADIINLIEQNYNKDIGLEWIAQKIYLSPGYISSLFKKETGKSVVQYITLCRMEKAKALLKNSNIKITDICQEVGYNNESYFCLLFRKYYGITANKMREDKSL